MPRTFHRLTPVLLAAVACLGLTSALSAQPVYNRWHVHYTDPGIGTANVINAQANLLTATQRATLLNERAQQAHLDTERQAFDLQKYIQDNTPTPEQVREKAQQEQVLRARNLPAPSDITTGKSLNDLLADIQKLQAESNLSGPSVTLSPAAVAHVNITAGSAGGVAMFQHDAINWPATLRGPRFASDRADVQQLADEAARYAATGAGNPIAANDLEKAEDALRDKLRESVNTISGADYIEAVTFLTSLESSVRALRQPDAGQLLTSDLAAHADTVGELVETMTRQGLHFAAAVPGDEPYYNSIYASLRAYDLGLSQGLARVSTQ